MNKTVLAIFLVLVIVAVVVWIVVSAMPGRGPSEGGPKPAGKTYPVICTHPDCDFATPDMPESIYNEFQKERKGAMMKCPECFHFTLVDAEIGEDGKLKPKGPAAPAE